MDSNISEQHDYLERAKKYSDMLQSNPIVSIYASLLV